MLSDDASELVSIVRQCFDADEDDQKKVVTKVEHESGKINEFNNAYLNAVGTMQENLNILADTKDESTRELYMSDYNVYFNPKFIMHD